MSEPLGKSAQNFVVVVDGEGKITGDPRAQRRLASQAGRYNLLSTTDDLIVMQRAQSRSLNVAGHIVVSGDIEGTGGLVDIIGFINSNNWHGQLAVVDGAVRRTVFFRTGEVCSAASNVPEERFGAILYRHGVIDEVQLEDALKASGATAKLGQVLVERKAITPHDVYTYVRKQIEEIFFAVVFMRRGDYYFYRTNVEDAAPQQFQLSTRSLLFDGVRRMDEVQHWKDRIPSLEIVFEPVPNMTVPNDLEEPARRVLALVDGARDVGELARSSRLGEFEAQKVLFQLLSLRLIRNQPPPELHRPELPEDARIRVLDTYNHAFARVYAAVLQRGKQAQLRMGVESFLASPGEFGPLFVGVELDNTGQLTNDLVLHNLDMAPTADRMDYLQRGLSELLFYELFAAGEAIDRREEHELHQRLSHILREISAETKSFY